MALSGPRLAGGALALVVSLPTLAVLAVALTAPDRAATPFFWDSVAGTALQVLVGGGGALLLGGTAALLVGACRFPGVNLFGWALVLPLVAPPYILAYAYSGLGGPGMPVRLEGPLAASLVYALACGPYVYLATRAALVSQSVCALEAARTLGASPLRALLTVGVPLAWPGLAAGFALAAMEIAADYGAAAHFGAQTITTGVFRAWFAGQNPGGAAQLAAVLVISAALLLALERRARGSRRFSGGSSRWRALHPIPLPGLAGWIACGFCAGLTILGAVLPFGYLLHLALGVEGGVDWAGLMPAAADTLMLGTMGGLVTFLAAGMVALVAARGGRVGQVGLGAASLGYAAPGAVLAVGLLSLYGLARQAGLVAGLGAGLGLMLLMWAYAARFTAAGAQPVAAGLERVTPHMTGAARTLGVGFWQRSWRLDMPLAAPSLLAAALIVFSEIVRELPATLILRPFGVETLATRAHALAADERLAHAAAPALLIVAIGVIPIVLLVAGMGRARAGAP